MKANEKTTAIIINEFVKETEKAVCVKLPVSWAGNVHEKQMWFPKSLVESLQERVIIVADWFLRKAEFENRYHGYMMYFEEF